MAIGVKVMRRPTAQTSYLRATLKGAEVEVRRGGQPHYPFVVSLE